MKKFLIALAMQASLAASVQEDILTYWFGDAYSEERAQIWFSGDPSVDREISRLFKSTLEETASGDFADWSDTPKGRLALIILFDQFTRNIYRGDKRAFAYDHIARKLALEGLALGMDRKLAPIERVFFYLPIEHAENRDLQILSVALFERLANDTSGHMHEKALGFLHYAHLHKNIIDRFGRYPHRNDILGRECTREEIAFLEEPDSSF